MYEKCVLKRIVSPFLLLLIDLHLFDILDIRSTDILAAAIILKQICSCRLVIPFQVILFHFFKSGTVKVQQIKHFAPEFLCSESRRHKDI